MTTSSTTNSTMTTSSTTNSTMMTMMMMMTMSIKRPGLTLLIAGLCLMALILPVAAQDQPSGQQPLFSMEAGDFRALAVTTKGERLFVADGENNQVRVFSFPDLESITTIALDGTPVAVAAADDYGLVAVRFDATFDLIQVIGPGMARRGSTYEPVNFIDTAAGVQAIAIAPNSRWGIAYGPGGSTVLELISASNINSVPLSADAYPISSGAFTADRLYWGMADAGLAWSSLASGPAITPGAVTDVDAGTVHLAINPSLSLGAAALSDDTVLLFAPTSDSSEAVAALDVAAREVHFLTTEQGEWLILLTPDGTIRMYEVTDPTAPVDLGVLELADAPASVRALATHNEFLVVAGSQQVDVYTPAP
ncbi:MAG: hypothetical protein GYB67_08875 [Chloroflexi bacterium]|nr:hypothetical protein [Chloroflexota bacterium]